ncbi:MAG: hypothetical protein IT450_19275 [Phycisphaerales bacterium]|nr:hypothetical protein [Phycisphaerales bacterium]
MMTILIAILLTLLNAASLLLVVIGLPGTWLMVAFTALAAWAQWDPALGWNAQFIGLPAIGLVVALALLGELAETFMGMAGEEEANLRCESSYRPTETGVPFQEGHGRRIRRVTCEIRCSSAPSSA